MVVQALLSLLLTLYQDYGLTSEIHTHHCLRASVDHPASLAVTVHFLKTVIRLEITQTYLPYVLPRSYYLQPHSKINVKLLNAQGAGDTLTFMNEVRLGRYIQVCSLT